MMTNELQYTLLETASSSGTPLVPESTPSSLCCCEFIDRENNRFHLLGCCCNCVHFDKFFTEFITCRRIDAKNRRNMLLTFQDRLRIPWRGGAKQVSPVNVIPIIVLPFVILIAAINEHVAIITIVICITIIGYIYRIVLKSNVRSRFFSLWLLWSLIYMFLLFESYAPLLELLPEEHWLLWMQMSVTLFMFWRAKRCATLNHVTQSNAAADELPDISEASTAEEENAAQTSLLIESSDVCMEQPNICSICHKYMPPRTYHCSLCGVCIKRRDHHSHWLDCCIGEHNHRYYMAGIFFGYGTLIFGAYLTLTAICHPVLIFRWFNIPIMLPDDCSEAFDSYEFGISFVIASYALIMAVYILVILIRQLYLISIGITLQEYRNGQRGNRKPVYLNWREFVENIVLVR